MRELFEVAELGGTLCVNHVQPLLTVLENRVLRRMLGPRKEGGSNRMEWSKLYRPTEELHDFYSSSDIVCVMKSKKF
jgi:hypothetical protein